MVEKSTTYLVRPYDPKTLGSVFDERVHAAEVIRITLRTEGADEGRSKASSGSFEEDQVRGPLPSAISKLPGAPVR
jgi:hypothetical protein